MGHIKTKMHTSLIISLNPPQLGESAAKKRKAATMLARTNPAALRAAQQVVVLEAELATTRAAQTEEAVALSLEATALEAASLAAAQNKEEEPAVAEATALEAAAQKAKEKQDAADTKQLSRLNKRNVNQELQKVKNAEKEAKDKAAQGKRTLWHTQRQRG